MNPAPDDSFDGGTPLDEAERGERLLQRWLRERKARHEAEQIAEAGLRRLYEEKAELDQRVTERTAQLESARSLAEAAARAKSEFLANLGHEVRTPLQTIQGTLDLATPADEADRRRIDDAAAATRRLRDMFNNLLELTQFEVGTAESRPEPLDLAAMTDEVVNLWRARLAARGLLLVPDCPSGTAAQVVADRARLVQIIDALLDNAARFAEPGTVRLTIRTVGNDIDVIVADDGPGVDHSDVERIFEPFSKLGNSASNADTSGAGVGLTIVRRVAEHLGGSAWAEASDSGGLAVTVRVPQPKLSERP